LASVVQAAVEGIQKRGGAKLGDKTLLDALIPTAEALFAAAGSLSMKDALAEGARAAAAGAEKTRTMTASKGRATYVGDRSLGHPDAGAMALGILFTEVAGAY
jgi:dihydroxyacetone kinase